MDIEHGVVFIRVNLSASGGLVVPKKNSGEISVFSVSSVVQVLVLVPARACGIWPGGGAGANANILILFLFLLLTCREYVLNSLRNGEPRWR